MLISCGLAIGGIGAVNAAPSDIALSNATVTEKAGNNAVVGALSTVDANPADTHTYSLVSGTGSTDNALFNISGANLRATSSLTYADAAIRSVRVRSTDGAGAYTEKVFLITVNYLPFLANFTGTNGTTLNGLVPDSGPNALVVRSGAWTIQSNRAAGGSLGIFTADIGRANYTATYVVRSSHGAGSGVKVIVRYNPSNGHYYYLYVLIGSNAVWLRRYDGSDTTLVTATPTIPVSADHTIVVTCTGQTIRFTTNGGSPVEITDASLNELATHIGGYHDTTGNVCLIDSISVP